MLSLLKGKFSANLLASQSHHTVSRASLIFAAVLALVIALLSGLFAFAQWRVADNLMRGQQQKSAELARRVAATADMATRQANAHRATLNVLLSRDSSELEEADGLRRSNLQEYRSLISQISDSPELYENAEGLRRLIAQYEELSAYVVDLIRQGRKDEALDLRVTRLRPLFNSWQSLHEEFSKKTATEDRRQQEVQAAASRTTKRWLAGLLLAPLVLIGFGILAIAGILGLQRLGGRASDTWAR